MYIRIQIVSIIEILESLNVFCVILENIEDFPTRESKERLL